jgi:DUF2889 family protein
MPLTPPPVARELVHTRTIECRGFARDDGMWDIEGHLTDAKAYAFENRDRGTIAANEPFHDMWMRLTVDQEIVVQDVETVMDASPFTICENIIPNFDLLKGLRIGPGWNREVRQRLGGVRGCAHLVDLLRPIATVAFHTVLWSSSAPRRKSRQARVKPPLNTCHAWSSAGEIVRTEFPDYYTGT